MNFNIGQIKKQAEEMQRKMKEASQKEVEGSAGGGLVKLKMTCAGQPIDCAIDESLLKPEEKEVLQDLIIAAIKNAKQNADATMSEHMQGMGIPSDMMGMLS